MSGLPAGLVTCHVWLARLQDNTAFLLDQGHGQHGFGGWLPPRVVNHTASEPAASKPDNAAGATVSGHGEPPVAGVGDQGGAGGNYTRLLWRRAASRRLYEEAAKQVRFPAGGVLHAL